MASARRSTPPTGQRQACEALFKPARKKAHEGTRSREAAGARRRLTLLLAGAPLSGRCKPLRARPNRPCAPRGHPPDDGGGDFTGRWVHAFAAYGAPKYGPDFTHFDYVNPRGAPRAARCA
jgi:hypothetical protein